MANPVLTREQKIAAAQAKLDALLNPRTPKTRVASGPRVLESLHPEAEAEFQPRLDSTLRACRRAYRNVWIAKVALEVALHNGGPKSPAETATLRKAIYAASHELFLAKRAYLRACVDAGELPALMSGGTNPNDLREKAGLPVQRKTREAATETA